MKFWSVIYLSLVISSLVEYTMKRINKRKVDIKLVRLNYKTSVVNIFRSLSFSLVQMRQQILSSYVLYQKLVNYSRIKRPGYR